MRKAISFLTVFMMIATLCFIPAAPAFASDDSDAAAVVEQVSGQQEANQVNEENNIVLNGDGEGGENPGGDPGDDPGEDPVDPPEPPQPYVPTIVKVKGLKVKTKTTTTITFQWTKVKEATSYEIAKYKNGSWVTIKKTTALKYQNTGLKSATGYKYKVRAIYNNKKTGDQKVVVQGAWSNVLKVATKPLKVKWADKDKLVKKFPYLKANWKKTNGTGYQIWASKSSTFKTHKTYWVKSPKTLKKTLKGLTDGKKYYVKIRAYKKYNGYTTYGAWSIVKSAKVKSTGWKYSGIKKYYYKNGKPFNGSIWISGNHYYFNEDGIMTGASRTMHDKVKDATSKTSYLVSVSRKYNRVCIYKKSGDTWVVYRYIKCCTGAAGSPTPGGTYTVKGKLYGFGKPNEYSVWNATRFTGSLYFHSVLCAFRTHNIIDGRLGMSLSHGCVRVSMSDSLWIYNNIGIGTKVIIC